MTSFKQWKQALIADKVRGFESREYGAEWLDCQDMLTSDVTSDEVARRSMHLAGAINQIMHLCQ